MLPLSGVGNDEIPRENGAGYQPLDEEQDEVRLRFSEIYQSKWER